MAATPDILEYARWLEEIAPGFIATVILAEGGEDYRNRDLIDQVGVSNRDLWCRWRGADCRMPLTALGAMEKPISMSLPRTARDPGPSHPNLDR